MPLIAQFSSNLAFIALAALSLTSTSGFPLTVDLLIGGWLAQPARSANVVIAEIVDRR